MPIIHLQGKERGVVVRITQTGRRVNRRCLRTQHGATESPRTSSVQKRPQVGDSGLTKKIGRASRIDHTCTVKQSLCATRRATERGAGSAERSLEERLIGNRCDRRCPTEHVELGASSTTTWRAESAPDFSESIRERLTVQGHHVGNRVKVDLLED